MGKYSIYAIHNTVNSKVYVGQTTQNVTVRFSQHMRPSSMKTKGMLKFYKAINDIGADKFYVETIDVADSKADADKLERFYIKKFDSFHNGYNSTPGAEGRLLKDNEDDLKSMYEDKVPISEIADYFGVCNATVIRAANRLKLNRRNRVTREYLLKNKDFKTNIEMAKELNVDTETISRGFAKYGIDRGKGCNNKFNKQNQIKITDDEITILKEMWMRKDSLDYMASILSVSKRTVLRYAKMLNLGRLRRTK